MKFRQLFFASCLLAGLTACGGGSDDDDPIIAPGGSETTTTAVTISEPTVADITSNSANVTAQVTATTAENRLISARGVCYSTSSNPTISDKTVMAASNRIDVSLGNLASGTTYYVRAYVTFTSTSTAPVYSAEKTFTTEKANLADGEPDLSGYEAPTYADNYASLADWNSRSKWNLANVHDPSVMLADDGYYYMYQTDASYGNAHVGHGHFHARRSKNLVDWEYLGATMPSLPSWANTKLNEIRTAMGLSKTNPTDSEYGYWAPCARKVKTGLYRMYYSLVVPGYINGTSDSWGERAFIGVMETSDPASNNWTDKGYVITNASDKALNFNIKSTNYAAAYYRWNAIDPTYIIDNDGKHWLIYGSWHSGIVALEVDADTGKPVNELGQPWGNSVSDISSYGTCIYTRQMGNRWQASEGPEIVYHDGYYYLFLAYDALDVPYNTRVVRSTKITGPYLNINGLDCTNTGGDAFPIVTHPYKFNNSYGWVGVSHCAVFSDGKDNWFFASQGRLPENAYGNAYANALMMGQVRRLIWTEDGWPVVLPERYGNVPQVAISESEIAGTWEHIDLGYSYGNMKEASEMVFSADHKITSGPWANTTWSFDAEKNVITVSNGMKLTVRRETDWESSTRKATLVYAAINAGANKTYWGKKD
jgi:beta-xylosidase